MENIDKTLKSFVDFKSVDKAKALLKREAQFGEDVKFEAEIIEKCAENTPTAAIIHFCNLQLKKKLLNKMVYKFSETIFTPPEEPVQEESKSMIVTTENEVE